MHLLLGLSLYFTYLNKSTVQNEGTVEICFAISKSGLFTCMLRRITDLGHRFRQCTIFQEQFLQVP
jgi:hypothetical protein